MKFLKILIAIHAMGVGLYPSVYIFLGKKFGLLQSKSKAILANPIWNVEFYIHITLGAIALMIGWTQFNQKLRANKLKLHRQIGKLYVICSLLSSSAGIYIAFFSQGNMIASIGFICLGVIWFYTTGKAYFDIRKKHIHEHQKMMIYSYSACFSAVTLRLYLYPLTYLFHDFIKAYNVVAWLCWVPNIIVAFFLVQRLEKKNADVSLIT